VGRHNPRVPCSVQFSINGTIDYVNLGQPGLVLKQRIMQDHDALLAVFEQMFGHKRGQNNYESVADNASS
jgi:hypothetical protein